MTDSTDRAAARERLSALIDGELGDAEVTHACAHWRDDAHLRASWHAYQLIGDALRSDDLCSAPGHDAAFIVALRARLTEEPVVLAPRAASAPPPAGRLPRMGGRARWTSAAVAAGFVAVVGVVATTRSSPPAEAGALARSDRAPALVATSAGAASPLTASPSPVVEVRGPVANGRLIRDVRLDRYLSAHKQFAGSSALGVPSGFLRNATADASDR